MGILLEEFEGSQLISTYGFRVCECLCRNTLAPGQRLPEGVAAAHLDWASASGDQLEPQEEYRYRLRYEDVYWDEAWKRRLPLEQRVTDWFSLRISGEN